MPIISATGLARSFDSRSGPVHAVRSVDLTVAAGEIVGLLGPNGAGKTTTLRMLTTLLAPTGGTATVAGHDLAADPAGVRAKCGYVAQSGGVDPHLTVREELVTQGRLYRLGRPEATARAAELAHGLGLDGLLDRRAVTLSGGQRRRLDIAMALTHRPPVLFLDEPTTGLDPAGRADLWELVRGLRDVSGTTVVLTTHYLDEADALADRLIVIDRGAVAAEGTPAALRTEYTGSPTASLQDTFLAITGRAPAPADAAPLSV
ncbi:ABC transporter ATP-binding protein [Streptomyces sp. ML-6]|uniref:ABC transporter ATP-binding protein n=1 Tax=Streptomyces sp. ML-6 TaxID=2982693 RepID=UPI0024C036F1|nr:ABC transporter ATP-binding protein [Streptomyces sp. ML-6]MDK0522261.1 ABC transporter ATP-binding protein [Streptomyces sp. ML-6]